MPDFLLMWPTPDADIHGVTRGFRHCSRIAVTAAAGAGAGALAAHLGGPSLDGPYFALAAHRFVGSAGLHVYADRGLQAGPWQLLWFYVVGSGLAFALLSGALVAGGLHLTLRALRRGYGLSPSLPVEVVVLALALGWGLARTVYDGGHPAELVIPALWGLAALRAHEGRVVVAGLAIGLATGWETWAVLGLPVLLAAPSLRQSTRAMAVAASVAGATYLPFVLVGPFRMGDMDWAVSSATLVHALAPGMAHFSWTARLVQAATVVIAATAAVVVLRRRQASAVTMSWLLPTVVLLAKISTDPQPRDYYWAPITAALLVGIAAGMTTERTVALMTLPTLVVSLVLPLQVWPVELFALTLLLIGGIGSARCPVTCSSRPLARQRRPWHHSPPGCAQPLSTRSSDKIICSAPDRPCAGSLKAEVRRPLSSGARPGAARQPSPG